MSEGQPQHSPHEDRHIIITRILNAPRDVVWRAYVDPDQVVRWWGPDGFTTTNHQMDVRPGGVWRFTMHGPDGRDYPNRVIFDQVIEPERLTYTHDDDGGVENISFHTTLTFETVVGDVNQTKITLHMTAPTTEERDRIEREYGAIRGGVQTLGRLADHVNPDAPAAITVALPSACELIVVRTFDAPRQQVFDAWTKPEMVKQWLYGPDEWPMVECQIDLKVGGKLRYVWRHKDKGDMGLAGTIREIDPPQRFVHTELFDEDWTDGPTLVTTVFREHAGRTVMISTVRYSSPKARDAALATPMLEGWGQCLDRAAELLERKNQPAT